MPRTKFQEIVFSLLMSLTMVLGMEYYNLALRYGGVEVWMFGSVWTGPEIPLLTGLVFVMEHFIAGPPARRRALRLANPKRDGPLLVTVAMAGCTVSLMCPIMSFWATVFFQYSGLRSFPATYIQTLACNFPMALLWQLFVAGPAVRWVFGKLFPDRTEESGDSALPGREEQLAE